MSNTCILLRNIENVSQLVTNFLSNPAAFTAADAAFIISQLELVKGSVRALPVGFAFKEDLLARLTQAQLILQDGLVIADPATRLLAVLQILQVVALKANNRPVCCTQGITTVTPSATFSSSCNRCCGC